MLVIWKEQWEALQKNLKEQFVREVTRHLRGQWPDKEALIQVEWVHDKVDEATSFDLTGRCAVRRYCELCVSAGPDFPQSQDYDWAHRILQAKETKPEKKLDEIEWTMMFGGNKEP